MILPGEMVAQKVASGEIGIVPMPVRLFPGTKVVKGVFMPIAA